MKPDIITPTISIHFSSRSEEWYTPSIVVERVMRVFGKIDLDPASNSNNSPSIPAKRHFTKADDGLSRDWHGRVFLNPPYGRDVKLWVAHLCNQYRVGNTTEAIALLHARNDTAWFSMLANYTLCFVRGRLRFGGQSSSNSAPFPSLIVYLGNRHARFARAFGDLGSIYRQVTDHPVVD
jgi:phage N-6-adenine-methyltransferase